MEVVITADATLRKHAARLGQLSGYKVKRILANALNTGGNKARTQIKKSLVTQTGIKYSLVNKAVKTNRATSGDLAYELEAHGSETNLNLFGARQGKRGVSARPWNVRRVFRHTFIVPAYSGRVFSRKGPERGPLDPKFGPNIAREIVKPPTVDHWGKALTFVDQEVNRRLLAQFGL